MAGILARCTLIWTVKTVMRVDLRMAYDQPFIRLAAILGGVTLFNAWAAWLVWSSRKACAGGQSAVRPDSGRAKV